MPDINSLPPSPNQPSTAPSHLHARAMAASQESSNSPPPLSHSPSSAHTLAATAAMNAGLRSNISRQSSNGSIRVSSPAQRRRSSIRLSLNLNDPALPGPGELQNSPGSARTRQHTWPENPSHQRNPSLGELHQELENEQELQVNRLLSMIRQQQAHIASLQNQNASNSSIAVDDGETPTFERFVPPSNGAQPSTVPSSNPAARPRSPYINSVSHDSSFRSSRNNSPSLRPMSNYPGLTDSELYLGASASRDESAFYQAETQTLTRENQMLRRRIQELERQLNPTSSNSHSPTTASNLIRDPISNMSSEATDATYPVEEPMKVESID